MRILLVDDEPELRDALKEHLETEGHEVRGASDGRTALDTLRAGFRAAVIILDLAMPVMDGWQFRSAQRCDPSIAHIPVVVLSASEVVEESLTKRLALAGFLEKPLDTDRLARVMADLARNGKLAT